MGLKQSLLRNAAPMFSCEAQQKKNDEVEIKQFAEKPYQMMQHELDAVRFDDITIPRKAELDNANCDVCLNWTYNSIAENMCFNCEVYLCKGCANSHGCWYSVIGHTKGVKSDFRTLMKEEGRRDKIMKTNISLCYTINIKHYLDRVNCRVTGLSGIGDNGWVVCDSSNFCIKLFDVNSAVIRRYIKFSCVPFDVTELKNSQTSNALKMVQGTRESGKENNTIKGTECNQEYLVAVTFPWRQHILVLNVKHNMTLRHNLIKMDNPCYQIDSCDNKIFTICGKKSHPKVFYSVYMFSVDGDILKIIKTGIDSYPHPYFAVDVNKIVLTDRLDKKVKMFDFEGNELTKSVNTPSTPSGICIGSDDTVYLCSGYYIWAIIYDSTHRHFELKDLIFSGGDPGNGVICFHSDKLYVGSSPGSFQGNYMYIKVVRLV